MATLFQDHIKPLLDDPESRTKLLTWTPIALGLTSHITFNRFEPHVLTFLFGVTACSWLFGYSLWQYDNLSVVDAAVQTIISTSIYLGTLATSIAIYRNSPLHPLYEFPGPRIARTTQLYWFSQVLGGKPRFELVRLHNKYGDFVRIGPNELSISNLEAVAPIHGASGWAKNKGYLGGLLTGAPTIPEANLLSQTFHAPHAIRRKIWDQGFTTEAMRSYAAMVLVRGQQLIQRLDEKKGKPIDVHRYAGYFVFDMTADLAFGGGFGLLEKGKDEDGLLAVIVQGNSMHGLVDSLLWLKGIFDYLPNNAAVTKVFNLSRRKFEERLAKGSTAGIKDIFSHLMDEGADDGTGKPLDKEVLAKESQLIVGAGADTTRTATSMGILYLAQHPDVRRRLQKELDGILASRPWDTTAFENAPFLNAVVNETLRLIPPVASGIKRDSPGAMICGRYIPAGIPCRTPNYTIQRDPRYFSPGPNEFRPARWLDKGEEALDRRALFPFQIGPFSCIGKGIAMHELRMSIGGIAATFDWDLAPGFDADAWLGTAIDRFMYEFPEPLEIVFRDRDDKINHGIVELDLLGA